MSPLGGARSPGASSSTGVRVIAAATEPTPAPAAARRLSTEQLFAGYAEVEIEHGPAVYRLRQTSLGKLILTK